MTREDMKRFFALEINFSSIGLEQVGEMEPCFCTPVGSEWVGSIGCDGISFVLLPGDERVFCVDPAMGEPGSYVLPVAKDFRTFLSYILFCRNTNPISQIWWMDEKRFRQLLAEDAQESWPGCKEYFAEQEQAMEKIKNTFGVVPTDPYAPVKEIQRDFDPGSLVFSDEYYDVLGLEH